MTVDLVWLWYLATVMVSVALFGRDAGDGRPLAYLGLHAALLVVVLALRARTARQSPQRRRWARGALAILGIPTVFSALGWVLPAVHPEPWEWVWIRLDHALFGADPTVALQAWLAPWSTELLQWVYAAFYGIPVVTVLVLGWRKGPAVYDRALLTVTFCFLGSYLLYFLWPTLPPYRFLHHGEPLRGTFLAESVNRALELAELHRWNCFPSGHTMLSLVCLVLAWQVRWLFAVLLPVVVLLILSTLALRYHYAIDVLAGMLLVWPGVVLSRRLDAWGGGSA